MSFREPHRRLLIIVGIWVGGLLGGFYWLLDYKSTPGATSEPPQHWPANAAILRSDEASTLLLFAHPLCPCTRASLHELAVIMTQRHKEALTVRVVFRVPQSPPAGWLESDIVQQAESMPGVKVLWDRDGSLTGRFGARTSGLVVLYDRDGELAFSGGITGLRGHEGENAGRDLVIAFRQDESHAVRHTPVFGCSLIGSEQTVCHSDHRDAQ